ncbi:MAG: hypothetical protein ACRDQA_23705 [Nocardioidaceae bacterium]
MITTLPMIEERLRAAGLITQDLSGLIFQGCWNDTVAASAGTHSGGGAIDVHPSLATTAGLTAWRDSGVAMWRREPWEGPWGAHAHGVWIGCPHLSSGAAYQVTAYRNGRDGLAANRADRFPRPGYTTWQDALSSWEHELNKVGVLTPDDFLQEVLDMDEAEFQKRVAAGVQQGMRDFIQGEYWPSPMEDPGRKANKWWSLQNIVRYMGAWTREIKDKK